MRLTALLLLLAGAQPGRAVRSFAIDHDSFVRDGTPVPLLSGSLHYTRVPAAYWRDRLARMRALGVRAPRSPTTTRRFPEIVVTDCLCDCS